MLREVSEATGGLCGRLGGDQFALLIPREGYREEALMRIADTLSKNYNSGIYTICIHFGVYEIDDASVPVSVMCGRANSALRTIRDDMSAIVAHFDDDIKNKLRQEQTVIGSFEDALKGRQFKMYLQPFASKDGSIFAAEALVRWHRPDGTVMMPGSFIETLEHTGLIQKLDLYMWELAVKQLSKWKGTEKGHIAISVNMSAKDFYSMDILAVLTGLVEKYGVDSRLLRLEITETALLVEPEKINRIVSCLRERGFLVAIDDFGTGFSSLSMMKTIHADIVKIDMDFLREIENNERNSIILRSVIKLADALGMDVITEGVETEQQLRTLTAMGCRHFQGYYFSRPVPVAEFEAKLSGTGGAAVS
jgi:EAL domain-containing protein (putative c-di-GMP-specific phosphodiesterase class I)